MVDWGAVGGLAGTIAVTQGAGFWWAWRSARAHSARGVMQALQAPEARMPYTVRLTNLMGAWNPSKPLGPGNALWGKARASYWLDADGLVRLLYEPVQGQPRHYTGPVPTLPAKRSWVAWGLLGVYAAAAGIGFIVAYSQAGGSSDDRLTVGIFGAMCGFMSVWFLALWSSVGRAVRQYVRPAEVAAIDHGPTQHQDAIEPVHPSDFAWPTGDSYAACYQAAKPRLAALRRQAWLAAAIFLLTFISFLLVPADQESVEGVLFLVFMISLLWVPIALVRVARFDHSIGRGSLGQ